MTAILRLVLPFLVVPMLGGCSAISALGDASRPLQIYQLQTPAIQPTGGSRRTIELVVEEPVTGGALATDRIMIRPTPLQAQYLPEVRWADTAPVMLQTLMVRSLMDTGAWSSVGRRPVGSQADFAILSELTDFQAEPVTEGDFTTVRIRLVARLVRESDARVIATRTFTATETVAATDTGNIIAAFDRTTATLLTEMVSWVMARTLGVG